MQRYMAPANLSVSTALFASISKEWESGVGVGGAPGPQVYGDSLRDLLEVLLQQPPLLCARVLCPLWVGMLGEK